MSFEILIKSFFTCLCFFRFINMLIAMRWNHTALYQNVSNLTNKKIPTGVRLGGNFKKGEAWK
jgi:hypothetical protein